jgi:hypothetical protein
MIEKTLAAIGLLVCVALLVRMVLRERQRQRMDASLQRSWRASRRHALRVWNWRARRKHAAREAQAAIRRARGGTTRDGNVIRPESFKKPRKPH